MGERFFLLLKCPLLPQVLRGKVSLAAKRLPEFSDIEGKVPFAFETLTRTTNNVEGGFFCFYSTFLFGGEVALVSKPPLSNLK